MLILGTLGNKSHQKTLKLPKKNNTPYVPLVCVHRQTEWTNAWTTPKQVGIIWKKSADVESKITEQANGKRYVDG